MRVDPIDLFEGDAECAAFRPDAQDLASLRSAIATRRVVFVASAVPKAAFGAAEALAASGRWSGGALRRLSTALNRSHDSAPRSIEDLLSRSGAVGEGDDERLAIWDFYDGESDPPLRHLGVFFDAKKDVEEIERELERRRLTVAALCPLEWAEALRSRSKPPAIVEIDFLGPVIRGTYAAEVAQAHRRHDLGRLPQALDDSAAAEIADALRQLWSPRSAGLSRAESARTFAGLAFQLAEDLATVGDGARLDDPEAWEKRFIDSLRTDDDDRDRLRAYLEDRTEPQATMLFVQTTFGELTLEEFNRLCTRLLDGVRRSRLSSRDGWTGVGGSFHITFGAAENEAATPEPALGAPVDEFRHKNDKLRRELGLGLRKTKAMRSSSGARVLRFDDPRRVATLASMLQDEAAGYEQDALQRLVRAAPEHSDRMLSKVAPPIARRIAGLGGAEDGACALIGMALRAEPDETGDPARYLKSISEERGGRPPEGDAAGIKLASLVAAQLLSAHGATETVSAFLKAIAVGAALDCFLKIVDGVDRQTADFTAPEWVLEMIKLRYKMAENGGYRTIAPADRERIVKHMLDTVRESSRPAEIYIAHLLKVLNDAEVGRESEARIAAQAALYILMQSTDELDPASYGAEATPSAFVNRHLFGGDENLDRFFEILNSDAVPEVIVALAAEKDVKPDGDPRVGSDDETETPSFFRAKTPAEFFVEIMRWAFRPPEEVGSARDRKRLFDAAIMQMAKAGEELEETTHKMRVLSSDRGAAPFQRLMADVYVLQKELEAERNKEALRRSAERLPYFVAFEWWLTARGAADEASETQRRAADHFASRMAKAQNRKRRRELRDSAAEMRSLLEFAIEQSRTEFSDDRELNRQMVDAFRRKRELVRDFESAVNTV